MEYFFQSVGFHPVMFNLDGEGGRIAVEQANDFHGFLAGIDGQLADFTVTLDPAVDVKLGGAAGDRVFGGSEHRQYFRGPPKATSRDS